MFYHLVLYWRYKKRELLFFCVVVTGLFEYHIKKSYEMYKVVAISMLFLELGMSLMNSAHLEII